MVHDPTSFDATQGRGRGRAAQGDVFKAGLGGGRPLVPTDPLAAADRARARLSREAFAYIEGGAGTQATVRANAAAFDRWQIWPRPLRDVSERDLSTTFLGRVRPTPFLLAPIGVMELIGDGADVAAASAAAAEDVPFVVSSQASVPMERSARSGGAKLFQLYWSASEELNASLLRRAEASGAEAIVVTVDTHLLGWRTRDLDLGYLPFVRGLGIAQYTSDPVFARLVRARVAGAEPAAPVALNAKVVAAGITIARKGAPLTGGTSLRENLRSPLPRAAVETFLDVFSTPALTWEDLAKAREWTSLPIIVKGIVHPDDAARALDAGVDGVWVSNHGGRQIDHSVPALDVLPEIAARVDGRVPVIVDSGVRTGAQAFIALALGADLVGLGRAYAYGLAIAGQAGVGEVIRNVVAELDITMGLAGCTSIDQVGPQTLRRVE